MSAAAGPAVARPPFAGAETPASLIWHRPVMGVGELRSGCGALNAACLRAFHRVVRRSRSRASAKTGPSASPLSQSVGTRPDNDTNRARLLSAYRGVDDANRLTLNIRAETAGDEGSWEAAGTGSDGPLESWF